MTLNTAKSAEKYYSSYSYQSSSLISYLRYSDLHHDCKPYEQTIECFKVSLYRNELWQKQYTFDFLKSFFIYILNTNRKLNTTEKLYFQSQFLILYLWWLRSTLFLVTMRSYRRSILLKSVKGSHLRAFIKKTTWNLKATSRFSANGRLKPTSVYCRTYNVSIKLSSVQNCW